MRVLVAGGGPVGAFASLALYRRGHDVVLVDRDAGPAAGGHWARRGVMQFHHPHFFRHFVVDALRSEAPDVLASLLDAGATVVAVPPPAPAGLIIGMRCRRDTVERHLRAALAASSGLTVLTGHVDQVLHDGGSLSGALVDGTPVAADLVIDATGRNGKLTKGLRPPDITLNSGESAISRAHQLLPGMDPGPINMPPGFQVDLDGYSALVFAADAGTFTTVFVRPSRSNALAVMRVGKAYAAACAAVPGISEWVDPERSFPTSVPRVVGNLFNSYRSQLNDGAVPVRGLISVGDSVCITNPKGGRGVSLGLMQVRQLLTLLDAGNDLEAVTRAFDDWCTATVRPWFDDHVRSDQAQLRVWDNLDIDLNAPLVSEVICAAARVKPELMQTVGPYFLMNVPPTALTALEPEVRALLATGWRPRLDGGPSATELATVATAA